MARPEADPKEGSEGQSPEADPKEGSGGQSPEADPKERSGLLRHHHAELWSLSGVGLALGSVVVGFPRQ